MVGLPRAAPGVTNGTMASANIKELTDANFEAEVI
jgi:hypothetical protein